MHCRGNSGHQTRTAIGEDPVFITGLTARWVEPINNFRGAPKALADSIN